MKSKELKELIILLLLETKFHDIEEYHELLKREYDCNKMNNRFNKLLDKFLNKYALNNTEKSEEHD